MNAAPHPIAWAVFADNGNIRLWSTDRAEVLAFADKVGAPLIALHPGPPIQSAHTDDAVGNASRLLRDAAQELAEGISVNGVPDWKNEPETHGAYVEHITAAYRLEQWADSIGAGGVEPLRRRECLHQIAEPAQAAPAAVAVRESFDADGFKEWVKRNLPDNTIIGSGEWWAHHLTLWALRFCTVAAAPQPPVAAPTLLCWVPEDELPESITSEAYSALFPHSRVDVIRLFPVFGPAELTTQQAPAAQVDALTYEQYYAIRQGHEIASSDAYFEARPQIDNNDRRSVFRAGFDRGWDAARTQAKEGGA